MSRVNNFLYPNIRLAKRIPTATILILIIVIIQVYSINDVQGSPQQTLKKVLAINGQQQHTSTNSQTVPKDVFIDQLLAATNNLVGPSNKPTISASSTTTTTTNQFQLQNLLNQQNSNNNTGKLRQVISDQTNQNVTHLPRRAIVSMSSSSSTDNNSSSTTTNNSNSISNLPLLQQPAASFGSLNLSRNNNSVSNVRQKWRQMERTLGETLYQVARNLKQTLDEIAPPSISATCRSALYEYIEALKEQKLWANKMFDASAKLPSGLFEGTLTELGNFDQCLSINSHLTTETQTTATSEQQLRSKQHFQQSSATKGQYCSLQIKPYLTPRPRLHTVCQRLPQLSSSNNQSSWRLLSQQSHQFHYVGLRLGICTPNKCSKLDIQQILSSYLTKYELLGQVKSCQTAMTAGGASDEFVSGTTKEFGLDLVQLSIVSTFVVLLVLVAIGTLIDYLSQVRDNAPITNKRIDSEASFSGSKLPSESRSEKICSKVAPKTDCKMSLSAKRYDRISVGGGPKRWQYQVYRGAFPRCALHGSHAGEDISCELNGFDCTDDCENDLKLQKNPLVTHLIASNDLKGYNMLLTDATNSRTSNQTSDDNKSEEAWLAKLENNKLESKLATKNEIPKLNEEGREGVVTSCEIFRLFLVCFSLRKNLKDISKHAKRQRLSYDSNHSRNDSENNDNNNNSNVMGDVKVIHGIRTLTIMWIIFAHTIGLVNPEMMNNLFSLAQNSCSSRFLQALLNATLAVNTFFMISGLVTVLSFARKCTSVLPLLINGCKIPAQQSPVAQTKIYRNSTNGNATIKQVIKRDNYNHNELEVSSTDSSSIISSLSSSASSNKCINARRSSNRAVVVPSKNSRILSKRSISKSKSRQSSNKSSKTGTTENKTNSNYNQQPFTWPNDFKPLTWLIMRYLRLTPAYAAIIGVSVVLPALGSGPFWQESINQMGTTCRRNWWINLTYLNNFIETDKLCLIHSWYLSNDWQFFSLTLILFGIFYKSKKFALLIVVLLIVSTSAATFAITVTNDFPPTIVTTSPAVAERWQFIHTLYYKPWPHLSSYLIGLITGYLIVIKDRIYLSEFWRFSIWILFSLVGLTLLNSIYPWNMGIPVEPLLAGLHSATFRTLWATCCAWLIFALVTKPQNPLAKFLSWQGFQITSRLTYCAYLVHPLIIYYHFGTLRERLDSSIYGQFHRYTATLLTTYLFALILSLIVESPSIQLQHFLSNLSTRIARRKRTSEQLASSSFHDGDVYDELTTGKRRTNTTKTDFTTTTNTNTNSWSAASSFSDQNSDVSLVAGSNGNGIAKHSESFKALSLGGASVFQSANHKGAILSSSSSSSPSSSLLSPPLSQVIHLSSKNLFNCKNISGNTNQQPQEAPQLMQSCSSSSSIEKPCGGGGGISSSRGELLERKKPQEFAPSSISALDADFQHKLAQAISRGFRIRSQIANGTVKKGLTGSNSYQQNNNINSRRPQSVALDVSESSFRQQQEQMQLSGRTNFQRDLNELNKYRELSTFAPSNKHKQQQQQQQQFATGKKDVTNDERRKSHDLSMLNTEQIHQARLIELPSHHRFNTNVGANLNEIILMKERLLSKSQSQMDVKSVGNK